MSDPRCAAVHYRALDIMCSHTYRQIQIATYLHGAYTDTRISVYLTHIDFDPFELDFGEGGNKGRSMYGRGKG